MVGLSTLEGSSAKAASWNGPWKVDQLERNRPLIESTDHHRASIHPAKASTGFCFIFGILLSYFIKPLALLDLLQSFCNTRMFLAKNMPDIDCVGWFQSAFPLRLLRQDCAPTRPNKQINFSLFLLSFLSETSTPQFHNICSAGFARRAERLQSFSKNGGLQRKRV